MPLDPKKIVQISGNQTQILALDKDGEVWVSDFVRPAQAENNVGYWNEFKKIQFRQSQDAPPSVS